MDYDLIEERLLWLEARGLAVAAEARRLRRRARRVALVDTAELVEEVARLSIVTRSRQDEVRIWRSLSRPPRRGRIVEPPAPRGLWARVRAWLGRAGLG